MTAETTENVEVTSEQLIIEVAKAVTELTAVVQELAKQIRNQPTEIDEFVAPPKVVNELKIPDGHKFAVVLESDYDDTLTHEGRKLNNVRATFESLDDARDYAHEATERPLFVGEIHENDGVYHTKLKLRYAPVIG